MCYTLSQQPRPVTIERLRPEILLSQSPTEISPLDEMMTQGDLFPEPLEPELEFVTVAKVGEIAEGRGRAFAVDGRMIAVFCENGQHFAIDDFCPHQGASLAEGHVENHCVACPWHFWRFDVHDGRWLDSPRIRVDAFPLRIRGDEIQVCSTPKKVE